jgi:predicted Zn-dependent peptidase
MMQFRHEQLDNGLDVIAEVNPSAATCAAGFFVRTGSRDESAEISGVSHFLEHMAFKGSQRRTAEEVNRGFDEIGADYNASTSEENTIFYGAVLPEFQPRLLDLLTDLIDPALRQEDFDVEKGVILDEIAVYDDQPNHRIYDRLMEATFAAHPLGQSILGTTESIGALTREQMLAYLRRRYAPGNITLVATGNIDFDALLDAARRHCGHWPERSTGRTFPPAEPPDARRCHVEDHLQRQHVGLASLAPAFQDDDRFAAQVFATILGDSVGSRLFYALIETAIAEWVHTFCNAMDRAGAMMTLLSCDPDQAGRALEIIGEQIDTLVADGPSEAELTAARNKIATGATISGELPLGRLSALGYEWLYNRRHAPLAETVERILSVTLDDVLRLAESYPPDRCAVVGIGPAESL